MDEKVRTNDWPDILLEPWSNEARRSPRWIQKPLACDFMPLAAGAISCQWRPYSEPGGSTGASGSKPMVNVAPAIPVMCLLAYLCRSTANARDGRGDFGDRVVLPKSAPQAVHAYDLFYFIRHLVWAMGPDNARKEWTVPNVWLEVIEGEADFVGPFEMDPIPRADETVVVPTASGCRKFGVVNVVHWIAGLETVSEVDAGSVAPRIVIQVLEIPD